MKLDLFLEPTKLIESENPVIVETAEKMTIDCKSEIEKAERIFYFIRDKIRYEFKAKFDEDAYLASNILKTKRGFCTQKAILFCALARACHIPAGIHFFDIIDHRLPDYIVKSMRTNVLYRHGIGALYLNGQWHKYDATLDIILTQSLNVNPVEFFPDKDCLMREMTSNGEKHIEYIADHGLYDDVNAEQIIAWFKQGYPHLIDFMKSA